MSRGHKESRRTSPATHQEQSFCSNLKIQQTLKAHSLTTAKEIWQDTDGKVDVFIAGVGTGGTLSGVGEGLKSYNPNIEIVAVEPDSSAVLSGEKPGYA